MSSNLQRLNINVWSHGTGDRHARGQGNIGLEYLDKGQGIQITLGRTSKSHYSHHSLSSAWAKVNPVQAHELAMAILYLIGKDLPCSGNGVETKHKMNLSVSLSFETDFCTMVNKREDLKKEILAQLDKKLDGIVIPNPVEEPDGH